MNDEGEAYFWKRKDSDDFLRYIKREAFELGYFCSQLLVTFYMNVHAKEWTAHKKLDTKQLWIVGMLYASRCWAISNRSKYLFQYYSRTPEER